MEDYEYIQNMPIVRNMKVKNKKLRTKNKELKKKNKELSKLVKLVFANLELLQSSSKVINDRIQSNIEIKKEPLTSPYEPAILNEDVEIISPLIDNVKKFTKTCVECGELIIDTTLHDTRHGLCYNCYSSRDCSDPSDKKSKEEVIEESHNEDSATEEDEEVEYEVSDDEQELDYGELAQMKGELEEYLEEKETEEEDEEEEVEEDEEEGDNGGDSPVEVDDEDEEEVEEVTIEGKMYYTTDKVDGLIYGIDEDGEISVEVGRFSKGKPKFYKK